MTTFAPLVFLFSVLLLSACTTPKHSETAAHTPRERPIDPFANDRHLVVSAPPQPTCKLAPVRFAYDSSDLDGASRTQLGQAARCMQSKIIRKLRIVGMTDPRGTEEYNLALGERRAEMCLRYMLALGVSSGIDATSVGEEMATGSNEEGWGQDRRADLIANEEK